MLKNLIGLILWCVESMNFINADNSLSASSGWVPIDWFVRAVRISVIGLLFLNTGFSILASQDLHGTFEKHLNRVAVDFGYESQDPVILVSVGEQMLYLIQHDNLIKSYQISTSKYGVGSDIGSNRTPEGIHKIRNKIGAGARSGTIFKGRKSIGQIADIIEDKTDDPEDYVTSRIMWLEGLEPQINQGGQIDSYLRYIYIHGTHEEGLIGTPASHGCIRMLNKDVIELFDMVEEGTFVVIIRD